MAIRVCCSYWREQKKEKAKANQVFIKALLEDVEERHKVKAIEQEIKYSKIIHAIQIVRYLRYKSGRFNPTYWRDTLKEMLNAM